MRKINNDLQNNTTVYLVLNDMYDDVDYAHDTIRILLHNIDIFDKNLKIVMNMFLTNNHAFYKRMLSEKKKQNSRISTINKNSEILNELINTQKYHIEQHKGANKLISMKISFMYAILEYLKTGTCEHQKGLLRGGYCFYRSTITNNCIEDIANVDVSRFTKRILTNTFSTLAEANEFKYHDSRRGSRQR